jgi:uncharacterized protein
MNPIGASGEYHVYAVPVFDHYLLYAPVSKLVALVNAAAVREVRTYLASGQLPDGVPSQLQDILNKLGPAQVQDPAQRRGPLAPAFLGIIPSRRCNMACRYCDFRDIGPRQEVMDPAIAVHAIDFMADNCEKRGQKNYQIQLFGGEPFIEDRVIDVVVHHARFVASRIGVSPSFVASTNGLFAPARRRFVGDYFDRIVLSLDGFREFHDRNRPLCADRPSFDEVVATARYLSTARAQLCIRCCVTAESVSHLEAIAAWLCEEFHPVVVNFEPMTASPESREAGLAPPSPYDFAQHALRSWQVLRSRNCEPASAPILTEGLQNTSCPVGKDAVIVHPDGLLASCYLLPSDWEARGMDLSIGRILADGTVDVRMPDVLRLRKLIQAKTLCARCFCRLTCAGGCHVNRSYPGCPDRYSDSCLAIRGLTAATLLEALGQAELADDLVADPEAMDRLCAPSSDRVVDCEGAI